MSEEQEITPDSPEAASIQTLTGWVCRHGTYFGSDERTARYSGSTHSRCECGAVGQRGYVRCDECQAKRDVEEYAKRERRQWDGTQMLFSEATDRYYSDPGEAAESGRDLADLRLVLCDPVGVPWLDEGFCADALAEDGDLPPEVEAAMEVFNAATKGIVLSWQPGEYALDLAGCA